MYPSKISGGKVEVIKANVAHKNEIQRIWISVLMMIEKVKAVSFDLNQRSAYKTIIYFLSRFDEIPFISWL